MKKFVYYFCFTLVAVPHIVLYGAYLFGLLGVEPGAALFYFSIFSFHSLVPPMLAHRLGENPVATVLAFVFIALLIRRIYLFAVRKEGVPAAFSSGFMVLAYVGFFSFALGMLAFAFSIAFQAGSGVPATLIMFPAMICIPWAIFLTELRSLWPSKSAEAPAAPA